VNKVQVEERYQTLYSLAKALNSLAPEVILRNFVETATRAVNAKGCSLLLFTPDKHQLIHTVSCGLSNDYLEKGPIKADTIIDDVLKGHPVVIADTDRDLRIQYKEQAKKEGIASMVSVPLMPSGEITGIMRVYTSEPRQFDEGDLDFLACLANMGAMALQRARVHEGLSKDLEERCQQIAEMTEERNRFLRFLSIAAHDLKAPLAAIQSYFGVFLGGYSGELNEKQKSMIERSSVRITELLKLISNLLDIPRIETGQLVQEMKECCLLDVINGCVAEMKDLAAQKGILLKTEIPAALSPVCGSSARLQQVFTNLVSNAINYTVQGEVLVRAIERDNEVQIDVMDSGIGIPPEDLPHIFTDFFRGSNVTSKGTGLGLSISKRIVEAHQGKIFCESPCTETKNGSRFSVVLPKLTTMERRQAS
jgi:signal transduction histidine kinase